MVSKRISKKARKAARAINQLLVAIVEEPKVAKVLSIMFNIAVVIGFIGFAAWFIFILVFLVAGKGELVTNWWNFNRDYPIFSIPLGCLTIFTAKFIGSILEPKPEPKTTSSSPNA